MTVGEGSVLAGKYRVDTLLGQGGMGAVWKGEHLALGAPVAIKLIDAAIANNQEALGRFLREAQSAATLRSPHVVQILDHGVDDATETPFIVMELLDGESLAQRLERTGTLPPEEVVRIVTHVSRALARAHEAGIIHRDLKPDNVFLVRNEDEELAKVLDFGIAKSSAHALGPGSNTRTGAVMGTPYYMSPEQISGSRAVDFTTDLWALGVIAYECLLGRRPFDAPTIGGLAVQICSTSIPPPSQVGPAPFGFDAWFERATARDANVRFHSARELADELRRVCAGEPGPVLSSAQTYLAPGGLAMATGGSSVRTAAGMGTAGMGKVGTMSEGSLGPSSRSGQTQVRRGRALLWAAVSMVPLLGGAGWWFWGRSAESLGTGLLGRGAVTQLDDATPVAPGTAPAVMVPAVASTSPSALGPVATAASAVAGASESAIPQPSVTGQTVVGTAARGKQGSPGWRPPPKKPPSSGGGLGGILNDRR